jgi:hypothetical protein
MIRPTPQAWLLALCSELRSSEEGSKDQQGRLHGLCSEQPCLGRLRARIGFPSSLRPGGRT